LGTLSNIDNHNNVLNNIFSLVTEQIITVGNTLSSLVPPSETTGPFIDSNQRVSIHRFIDENMKTYTGSLLDSNPVSVEDLSILENESPKMYAIIRKINENPNSKHIIYCQSRKINVALAHNLRRFLNYTELFGRDIVNINSQIEEKKYMFLTGQVTKKNTEDDYVKYANNNTEGLLQNNDDDSLKEQMIQHFNVQNPGSGFNVIILNTAAAEGITLKKVHYVHFLQVPSNMSRLYQIIGRAIRNCTHYGLPTEENYVTPILYLTTAPSVPSDDEYTTKILNVVHSIIGLRCRHVNGNIVLPSNREIPIIDIIRDINAKITRNITKYEEIVRENDNNLPYLRLLKEAAIDCDMNSDTTLNCYSKDVTSNPQQDEIYNSNYRRFTTKTAKRKIFRERKAEVTRQLKEMNDMTAAENYQREQERKAEVTRQLKEMNDMTAAEKYQREQDQFQQEINTRYRINRIGNKCPNNYKVDEKNKQWCIRK
jgi:hypothetical protein